MHRWITLALLSGDTLPLPIDDQVIEADEAARRAFLNSGLGLEAFPERDVTDVTGRPIKVGQRIVDKFLASPDYLKRTPYIPWAPFALTKALEVWRRPAESKMTGALEIRDYYLAPLVGHKSYEGYVAIVHDDTLFNLIPAEASYIEKQRSGDLIWQGTRFSPCVASCCAAIKADRDKLRDLGVANRKLQAKLTREKDVRRDLERKLKTIEAGSV